MSTLHRSQDEVPPKAQPSTEEAPRRWLEGRAFKPYKMPTKPPSTPVDPIAPKPPRAPMVHRHISDEELMDGLRGYFGDIQ